MTRQYAEFHFRTRCSALTAGFYLVIFIQGIRSDWGSLCDSKDAVKLFQGFLGLC